MKNIKSIQVSIVCTSFLLALIGQAHAQSQVENGNRSVSLDRTIPCTPPPYPEEALMRNEEGRVVVGLNVGVDGKVTETRIDTSSGSASLDKVTQEAFSRCQFKPAMQNGQPVKTWAALPINWRIPNDYTANLGAMVKAELDAASSCDMPKAEGRIGGRFPISVVLNLLLDTEGNVLDSKIFHASEEGEADEKVREGMNKCRYKPVNVNGRPAKIWAKYVYKSSSATGTGNTSMNSFPSPAKLISCARPVYPTNLEPGIKGETILSVFVGMQGKVVETKIKASSGQVILDEAYRKAIDQCQFIPARANGSPISSWLDFKYDWANYAIKNAALDNNSVCPRPNYPASSARLNEQGRVVVKILVGTDGTVLDSKIEQSSSYQRLDNASQIHTLSCQLKPALIGDQPVIAWRDFTLNWQLPK